jgi:hypothetical protein
VTEGWTSWREDRRYPAEDGERMIIVYKRTVTYGGCTKVRTKNQRRKLSRADKLYLESVRTEG